MASRPRRTTTPRCAISAPAEARLAAAKANRDLIPDQPNYTELKAEFDGVVTAVGAEAGQNVTPGQLVVRLAPPGDKDAVFSIAETAIGDRTERAEVLVWPLSNPDVRVKGVVREISPVADPATRTYTVKVALKDPPPEMRFGMSIGGRWKGSPMPVIALPLSALFKRNGAPAVWVFNRPSGSVMLKPVTIARYEADTVIIGSGVATGDIVVTAGIDMLREKPESAPCGAGFDGSDSMSNFNGAPELRYEEFSGGAQKAATT